MRIFAAIAFAAVFTAPAIAQEQTMLERGRAIAETSCATCHAVERSGESPHREAPALREIANRYSLDSLEEAFGEGIHVGHADMPEFRFEPDEIQALIFYLGSIQDKR